MRPCPRPRSPAPTARWLVIVGLVLIVGSLSLPAAAIDPPPIVFPVAGDNAYRDTFGAPRDGGSRSHKGTDIIAARMVPVVAILDGIVTVVSTGAKAGTWIEVEHAGGWRSRYLHLNNDTPGTDDGRGSGVADGVRVGASVAAGRVIGYVGDSGNAETTTPHLHFEIRAPGGAAIDPYPVLRGAVSMDALLEPAAGLSLVERAPEPGRGTLAAGPDVRRAGPTTWRWDTRTA